MGLYTNDEGYWMQKNPKLGNYPNVRTKEKEQMNFGAFMQWDTSGIGKQDTVGPMTGGDLKTLPSREGSRRSHSVIPFVCIPSGGGS